MLTTVAAFREPSEAHMFCARLEAEGIPAFVAHERHVGTATECDPEMGDDFFDNRYRASSSDRAICLDSLYDESDRAINSTRITSCSVAPKKVG